MNALRDEALTYVGRGWRVLRLHSVLEGRCTCRDPDCISPGKHPWGLAHGLNDATTDPAVIERWWQQKPRANIGVRAGSGLVIVDVDGAANVALLQQLAREHGPLPTTLQARTGRGFHLYYAGELDGSPTIHGLLIRGEGGYVVAPPSRHVSGATYQWVDGSAPIARAPDWLMAWIAKNRSDQTGPQAPAAPAIVLGPRPDWIDDAANLGTRATANIASEYPLDAVLQALRRIPASCNMKDWLNVARSLHDWDAGELGLQVFKRWSATSQKPEHQDGQLVAEKEWNRIKKSKPGKKMRHISSLFTDAKKYGPPVPVKPPQTIEPIYASTGTTNGFHAETETFATAEGTIRRVTWADKDKHGNPQATCTNARIAIEGLGLTCRHDTFQDRLSLGGHAIAQWAGELSDNAVLVLRRAIKDAFRFDPGPQHARDAAVQACLANQYNPVVDYLAGLQWDGRARIGRWVVDYLGCPDEPLGCEFGRLMLIAAVRRARRPGTKFDQIIVLEGREGTGKSTALRILAGDYFSDQRVLGMREREQQEASAGVWIHEIAELAGMKRADVEHVKAFASRQEDRARAAYGRFRVDRPRQTLFAATTNAHAYLKSDTGDRRFWPLGTGRIDLEGVTRDRDQLWAEAAMCEARGDSIGLDPRLYADASAAQMARQELDPWSDNIAAYANNHGDTSVPDVLTGALQLAIGQCTQVEMNRAARVLKNLGFERYQKRDGDVRQWRYKR